MKEKKVLVEACVGCGFFHKYETIREVVGFCRYYRQRIEYLDNEKGLKPLFCRVIALILEDDDG